MTPLELCDLCKKAEDQGLDRIYVSIPKPKSKPPKGYAIHPRIRLPGIGTCKVLYQMGNGGLVITVPLDKAYTYLQRYKEQLEKQVKEMENGQDNQPKP